MFSATNHFAWLGYIFPDPELGGGAPVVSGNYVAENGVDQYVAEDGVSPYVTET